MIDENSDDMRLHKEEVVEVMKLAIWCLQSDKNRRPAMSLVVKFIEEERDVEANLDYNFFDLSPAISVPVCPSSASTKPTASILSAPRWTFKRRTLCIQYLLFLFCVYPRINFHTGGRKEINCFSDLCQR
jgi:hypothetical protein